VVSNFAEAPGMRVALFAAAAVAAFLFTSALPAAPPAADVLQTTLPNGLRVIVVRDALAPVVTVELNYLAGSAEAPPGFPGMAHAQEHMMFRSSEGLSTGQLANIDAAMGGDVDADTQDTVTQFISTVPADDLDIVLRIESIRMRGVLDTPEEWEQERGAIEQEVARDLSAPFYKFLTAARRSMFAGTPYEHDALGTRASFDKTTAAMIKAFYNQWYHPNDAILVITGAVDPKQTVARVQHYFGAIPRANLPALPETKLGPSQPAHVELTSDYPVPIVVAAYRFPGYASPDYAAAEVLSAALANQRGALADLAVSGKALAAGFFQGDTLPQIGSALVYGATQGGDAHATLSLVQGVIAQYAQNGVPQDLVDAAKRQLIAQAEFEKNSISGLADAWSQAVAVQGLASPDEDVARLQRVTKDDVDRVAREYLSNATSVTGILTPHPSGGPVAARGYGGAESFTPAQNAAAALPGWAAHILSSVNVPPATISPQEFTLANGVHLIVVQESITPTVTVLGRVKSNPDLETAPGKEGVSEVLGSLFPFGTTTLDRVAFAKALDDIAATESAGADFSLSVLSPNFDRGIQLLADNELHPALPPQNFAVVRSQTAYALRGEMQTPDYLTSRALNDALYPKGDPTQREATPDSVSALSLDDVKEYYAHVFRPDLTTIIVIGDVTPDQAKASIEKWFGGWTASGQPPPTDLPPVPDNKPVTVDVPNASRVQDSVTLAETVGVTHGDPDYYALVVGDHVLGGGFYATRLYRDIRERAGLAYEVSNNLNVGKMRSLYSVSYGCDPQNVGKVRAIVARDLHDMQTSPVSARELLLAKALLMQEIPLREASENAIAEGLLSRAVAGLPLDEQQIAARKYVDVTASQIQAAFAKWIRPDGFVQVTQGPAPR
jgi:zinc protease